MLPVVLDSAGLSAAAEPKPPKRMQALLAEAYRRGSEVLVPAVVCAEVCRGVARTRQVETLVARTPRDAAAYRPVRIIPTDFDIARQVGAILNGAKVGSRYLADAHVVAVCAEFGGGLVITSDPDDIMHLAAAVPAARIITRSPD
ncbi:type II toxin-antitoxin system VapC family toxin [Nocardia sp. CA-290969]|uniref:type II toxin-antitoxin system VapC family toxin n=1 Tax=Nocardia sp. CA-290969 TaxID=3239986 RepID=UPI003D922D49